MGHLEHVEIEIVVREHCAADGRYADGALTDVQFVDDPGDQTVDDAVPAAGTIPEWVCFETQGLVNDLFHVLSPAFIL
jgi:hypothetical protein